MLKAGVRLALKDGPVEIEAVSSVMHWDGKLPFGARWICHFLSGKTINRQEAEIQKGKRENHRRTCMWTQHTRKNKGG